MQPGSKHEQKAKTETVPHHKAAHLPPESRVDAGGGTSKRNIVRRGGPANVRKQAANKHHTIEDEESTAEVIAALDENDPNFEGDDPAVVSSVNE